MRSQASVQTVRGQRGPRTATGGFVTLDGEPHYRIAGCDLLPAFLISLASDTDLWMFVTSRGGLTAGRVDPDGSLLPYETVDRLLDAHRHTGPVTLIRCQLEGGSSVLWEPFGDTTPDARTVEHNLYKTILGNSLVFEARDPSLGLVARARWSSADALGWIRTVTLQNTGATPISLDVLDGLRGVLPHGAPLALYQQASNLVDAYKTTQVDPQTRLAIFALTTGITDRAQAHEVLRANIVWSCGLAGAVVHLDGDAVAAFRDGRPQTPALEWHGRRGNYLLQAHVDLEPGACRRWYCVGDTGRDHGQIAELRRHLAQRHDLPTWIETHIAGDRDRLRAKIASADGLQLTQRPESDAHHLANVLFNIMRGGVFDHNDDVLVGRFAEFVGARNAEVARAHADRLVSLPRTVTVQALRDLGHRCGDPQFERLCHEYLPLYFGRRHGDPSRPWNRFAIRVRTSGGERELNYEGNWRDIFQNWEALAASFPGFLPSIVARFVGASTVDGFNPYRITRDGVDWEVPRPQDPWSNIGYWGDHQLIYLLRLLEAMERHDPAAIDAMLGAEIFSYTDVPYRLRPYADIVRDPRATIDFDDDRAARIAARIAALGTDGALVCDDGGRICLANLLEKLIVPALAKLSNLVPGAGVWMNTQRPEWNDANNALGGGAASVVTLCHLHRYLAYLADVLGGRGDRMLPVHAEVVAWFARLETIFAQQQALLDAGVQDPRDRRLAMDALGQAFSDYRAVVYARGLGSKTPLSTQRVAGLCRAALAVVDRSIAANRRDDGLYHTYNLLDVRPDAATVPVARLDEMLEGQVAVLDAGVLSAGQAVATLERLFASRLHRPDQRSFLLYPARRLPPFLARNQIPAERAQQVPLMRALVDAADTSLVYVDVDQVWRFAADLSDARALEAALDRLARQSAWAGLVARDRAAVVALYEDVFGHRAYTGRSGYMYAYEGLGCIYWHMVAKLLLAVQETLQRAERDEASAELRRTLVEMYDRVRAGLGYEKSVAEYGAFPTDPYSHTPAAGGAKQPGMSGQVKEEILTRFGELGVRVEGGRVRFNPTLLRACEFRERPGEFAYVDVAGEPRVISIPGDSLAFTFCQVPVVYTLTDGEARIRAIPVDGEAVEHDGCELGPRHSAQIFARDGRFTRIEVLIPRHAVQD